MPKPFASARIPEAIDEAIKKRIESGSESRTDIIVNALNTYLGYPLTVTEGTPAADRLDEIEKRLAALESKLKQPIQGNLLDDNSVIKPEKEKKKRLAKDRSSTDNKLDNKKPKPKFQKNTDKSNDKSTENTIELSTSEVCGLIGIGRQALNYRNKTGKLPFTANGHTVLRKIGKGKSANGKAATLWEIQKTDNKSD